MSAAMPQTTTRRLLAAGLLVPAMIVPLLLAPGAAGDAIGDKRAEARRIAARLNDLDLQTEVLTEDYNNAKIHLGQVKVKVHAAQAAVDRGNRRIATRRRQLARYAVGAYMAAGDDALGGSIQPGRSDAGARAGYASAALGDQADLIDSLRAAQSDGASTLARLRRAQKQADGARSAVNRKYRTALAAQSQVRQLSNRVQGQLKALVAAEQVRVAAAQLVRAEAAARAAAFQARLAPPPAAPSTRSGGGGAAPVAALPQPPVGQGAAAAIAAARSVLGVRYTWAGASPSTGFDCSGLVMWAWAHGGKSLSHSSRVMYASSRKIPISALQPGDLVFYGSPVHHIGLYIGGGQMIHSPHTGSVVQVSSIYYWSALVGAGRV